jgi:hypothetical protein
MTTRHASCSCGQLRVETSGEPLRVSVCHCLNCQRRSGSAFAVQARFPRTNVAIQGQSTQYVLTGDSGQHATFHFCPVCGATVYYQAGQAPEVIAVPVGAFADPAFPPPTYSVYEDRQHKWLELRAPMEHMN